MKGISSEKGRLPKSIFGDFWWFLGSPGRPKNAQKLKKCLPKIDRKKRGKKGGDPPRPGRGSAAIARPEGMQDSCSGRFLPWFLTEGLYTPPLPAECGGFFSLARSPPTLGIERFKGTLVNHCPLWQRNAATIFQYVNRNMKETNIIFPESLKHAPNS